MQNICKQKLKKKKILPLIYEAEVTSYNIQVCGFHDNTLSAYSILNLNAPVPEHLMSLLFLETL
jgi:hypothetical protein